MKPFLSISLPGLLSYPDFKREVEQPGRTAAASLKISEDIVRVARKELSALKKSTEEHKGIVVRVLDFPSRSNAA